MSVVVIGIDGLDPDMVRRWSDSLPNLGRLVPPGEEQDVLSVFPPDSIPAWATIHTGLTPDVHGIMGHVDYLDSDPVGADGDRWGEALHGRTFWDEAARIGARCAVVNPFLAFPAWPIDGVMVSGSIIAGTVSAEPQVAWQASNRAPMIGGIADFPGARVTRDYLQRTWTDIRRLTEYARALIRGETFDLVFVTYLQLDRLQHFLWRYADCGDPTHPHGNSLVGALRESYELMDTTIGEYRADMCDHDTLIVLSDHGHGRRCERVMQVNELLRLNGLLTVQARRESWLERSYALERTKNLVLRAAYRFALEEQAFRLARRLPNKRALKTGSHAIDRRGAVARASAIGGTNPFGGIEIDRAAVAGAGLDYESVRDTVKALLTSARDGEVAPVLWVADREEHVSGEYAQAFPDVMFEMRSEYGVGMALYEGLFGPNTMHRRVSGGHRRRAFFGVQGPAPQWRPRELQDIFGFVTECMGAVSSTETREAGNWRA